MKTGLLWTMNHSFIIYRQQKIFEFQSLFIIVPNDLVSVILACSRRSDSKAAREKKRGKNKVRGNTCKTF